MQAPSPVHLFPDQNIKEWDLSSSKAASQKNFWPRVDMSYKFRRIGRQGSDNEKWKKTNRIVPPHSGPVPPGRPVSCIECRRHSYMRRSRHSSNPCHSREVTMVTHQSKCYICWYWRNFTVSSSSERLHFCSKLSRIQNCRISSPKQPALDKVAPIGSLQSIIGETVILFHDENDLVQDFMAKKMVKLFGVSVCSFYLRIYVCRNWQEQTVSP